VESLRKRLEQHRKDPTCSVCHSKMDPLGFGLENFDAIGAWRDSAEGTPIDSSGTLPNGQTFKGPTGLIAVLKSREQAFRRSLVQKMLTFALGRGTESFDRAALNEITERTQVGGDNFSSLVISIVKSDPFQHRRGEANQ
jgi:hypothetical protein